MVPTCEGRSSAACCKAEPQPKAIFWPTYMVNEGFEHSA